MTVAPLKTAALPERLNALVAELEAGLLERDTAARLVLLAALAGEHVLLIGPPGTAKSELARRLRGVLAEGADDTTTTSDTAAEGRYFERLLTRFSTPEELFGPLSLKALEEDRYERLTAGYLPTAQVAFLDEVFKANSAILNALLTLLNERAFDNGTGRRPVPLVSVVGASNEVPGDESLQAFYDRFLLRVPVQPVGDAAFEALLAPAGAREPAMVERLAPADCAAVRAQAATVVFSEATGEALRALRQRARAEDWRVSDRRWRQFAGLLRVAAAAEGRPTVEPTDLWLAAYGLPAEPAQAEGVLDWLAEAVLHACPPADSNLLRAVQAFEKQLEIETQATDEGPDGGKEAAGKMALARNIGGAGGQGAQSEMLRLYSERLEQRLRKRWSPLHLRARVAQVEDVAATAKAERTACGERLEALQAQLDPSAKGGAARCWLPPTLAARWLAPLRHRVAELDAALARLARAREGFAALPVDEALADTPLPVRLDAA